LYHILGLESEKKFPQMQEVSAVKLTFGKVRFSVSISYSTEVFHATAITQFFHISRH